LPFIESGYPVKKSQLREQKKKTTRDAILRTAQKLFTEKGFENTAVEDITRQINIAQSTFFNYFPRKEDIIPEMFRKKLPALKKKWTAILDSTDPVKTKIHDIFFTTVQLTAKNENISRALLINNISSLNQQYDRAFFEEFRISVALILEKGQHEGHIRQDIAAVKLATMLEGIFNLFVIDCLVKRICKISSDELYQRLNLCLEGFLLPASIMEQRNAVP
jgi:AcrR family transcriptional regulator